MRLVYAASCSHVTWRTCIAWRSPTETNTELLDRLVVGRSVDGRSRHDAQAKLRLVTAGSTEIPAGALVLLMLASANHDEEVFTNAHQIDLRRPKVSRHQAFGGGLHHCLGAPLAQIQLQETLKGLVKNHTRFELANGPSTRSPSLKFPALTGRLSAWRSISQWATDPKPIAVISQAWRCPQPGCGSRLGIAPTIW